MELIVSITSKSNQTQQFVACAVTPRIVFGRTPDSPVVLDGPGVSREHLAVESENGELFVVDLSSNGSWVNGTRLPRGRRHRVQAGDLVELPGYELRLETAALAPVAGPETAVAPAVPGVLEAAGAEPVAAPAAKPSPLALIQGFWRSFTSLERFAFVVDVICIGLLIWYFTS